MKRTVLIAICAASVVIALAFFDVTKILGAHPFWSLEVALYGAVPGVILAMGLSMIPRWGLIAALGDLALAAGITWWGKRAFVASSGDDALGGQMWFFGWIAVCACLVAVITLVVRARAD